MRKARDSGTYLRNRTPLVVRGSSTQTFRSLGLFAEGGLLFCGGYLLAEPMLSPLKAGAMSVIGGGLFLALATVLLFYLAWPTYAKSVFRRQQPREQEAEQPSKYQEELLRSHRERKWMLEKEEELPGPM